MIIAGTETVLIVKMEGGAAIGKGGGHNERTEVGAELHITTREREGIQRLEWQQSPRAHLERKRSEGYGGYRKFPSTI